MNLLAADLIRADDPVALARAVGPEPYDYQIALLRSTARQILLNWSRQAGKSTATALLPLHMAMYQAKSLTLIASPSGRQSVLLLDKVYESLAAFGWTADRDEKDNTQYLRLRNGSEVYAVPGKDGTVRGFSGVDLLVIDEASRTMDGLYFAVRPMLAASGGRLVLLSTPFGKRGFFFREWTQGANWERHEVPAEQVPHISPEFLAEERDALPAEWFEQEYHCRFMDTVDQIFGHELVASLMRDDIAPLFGEDAWQTLSSDVQPLLTP